MTIIEVIDLALEKSELSPRALSLAAGLGPNTVREIKAGSIKTPSLDVMMRICKAGGVSPSLLTEED